MAHLVLSAGISQVHGRADDNENMKAKGNMTANVFVMTENQTDKKINMRCKVCVFSGLGRTTNVMVLDSLSSHSLGYLK